MWEIVRFSHLYTTNVKIRDAKNTIEVFHIPILFLTFVLYINIITNGNYQR